MRRMHREIYKNYYIHGHIYLRAVNSTMIHWKHLYINSVWNCACCLFAGLMNGRAALLWQGKARKLFMPLSAFMPEESCTVILTLSYFSLPPSTACCWCLFRSSFSSTVSLPCSFMFPWPIYTTKLSVQNLDIPPNMLKSGPCSRS